MKVPDSWLTPYSMFTYRSVVCFSNVSGGFCSRQKRFMQMLLIDQPVISSCDDSRPSTSCMITSCYRVLELMPEARDGRGMYGKSIGYHIWRLSSRQFSDGSLKFCGGQSWYCCLANVGTASERTGTGFYS